MASFNFNGVSSDTFNIVAIDVPVFQLPERKYKKANVFGRNGNSYFLEDAWEEVLVKYNVLAGSNEPVGATGSTGEAYSNYNTFDAITEWLNGTNGYAKLYDSFDPDHYRMAVCIDTTEVVLGLEYYGKATITFRCRPERYLTTSALTPTSGVTIINPTNHIAEPIITISGGGGRSLLKLEDRTAFTPPNTNSINYYDSISDFLATKDSTYFMTSGGIGNNIAIGSTSYAGNISSAVDQTGVVQFSSLAFGTWGVGFILEVMPDSDYSVSFEADKDAMCTVKFATQGGNSVNGSAWQKFPNSTGAYKYSSWTFHTYADSAYIMLTLGRVGADGNGIPQFKKIMVNQGSTALQFRPYAGSSIYLIDSSVTLNNTTISFSSYGFTTAVIDCEHENFAIDGVNSNNIASVTDQFGNISVEYLRFKSGNNKISWTGEITTASIDPRFWEL